MTAQTINRRLRFVGHAFVALSVLILSPVLAWQAGDWRWPYVVQSVDVVPDPVQRGGTLSVIAVRSYLEDCDLYFARQIESVSQPAERPLILPEERMRTPWGFNGKPHKLKVSIPADFPCGPAQIRTVPSAACNWLQEHVWRQHSRDALTPFEIACDRPG